MRTLYRGAMVVDPASGLQGVRHILVEGDRILAVTEEQPPADRVVDLDGLYLFPGFIELHAHFREPGQEHKEDLESGAWAALHGGYTTVLVMPNTDPPLDTPEAVAYIRERSKKLELCDLFPVGAITRGRKGQELAELAGMAEAGALAFSDDGDWVQNASVMRRALEYARISGKPIITHAEDPTLAPHGVMNESVVSLELGLPGKPREAEAVAIYRDLALAALTGGRLHVAHVSTAEGLRLIREAKQQGLAVTCETAPHYLILTDEAVRSFDPNTKVNPPLRRPEDREALRKGLAEGAFDAVATDHAPHAPHEKELEFLYAPFGMIGLETAFPLLYTELVREGHLSLDRLVEALTAGPARVVGLQDRGRLQPGLRADFTVFDLEGTVTVEPTFFRSRSRNSPFLGRELQGRIVLTVAAGKPFRF